MRIKMLVAAAAISALLALPHGGSAAQEGTFVVVWTTSEAATAGRALIAPDTGPAVEVTLTCGEIELRSTDPIAGGVFYAEGPGSDGVTYRIKAVAGGVGGTTRWGYSRTTTPRDPTALHCGAEPIETEPVLLGAGVNGTLYVGVHGYQAASFTVRTSDN